MISSLTLLVLKERDSLQPGLKMLWRLKWLYISIFVVYGWFTPGNAVVSLQAINASYLPTIEGLQAGALRVSVLIAIVSMISSLLQTIEKEKLVSAIIWLTAPLQFVGVNTQRFALLLILSLDKVLVSETTIREYIEDNRQKTGLMNTASRVITRALANVENTAGHEQLTGININEISTPPLWQWLLPCLLLLLFYSLSY